VALNAPLVFADRGMVATALTPGLRIGGWSELGGISLPPNPAHFATLRRIAGDIFPGLMEAPAREWMGHRPSTPDSVPVLSRSRRHPAVFYAVGHGHYGMSLGARTAEVMGELIAGGADEKYAAFSIRRFA
jgi:D-amino-acid dehydrogenase